MITICCQDGSSRKVRVKKALYNGKSHLQAIAIYDTYELGRCLFLDNVIQSCDLDHDVYDKVLLRKLPTNVEKLLILGGGDGYVADTALRLSQRLCVTVVEVDSTIVEVCKEFSLNKAFESSQATFVIDDAIHFMRQCRDEYEHIICDLTDTPISSESGSTSEFYTELLHLIATRMRACRTLSLYLGCDKSVIESICRLPCLEQCEVEEISIPSFGEPCYVLHGRVTH